MQLRRHESVDVLNALKEPVDVFHAQLVLRFELFELCSQQRAAELGHAGIESKRMMLIPETVFGAADMTEAPDLVGELVGVGGDDTPFSTVERLRCLKAED